MAVIVTLQAGPCAELSAGDRALYDRESDVDLASRVVQTTLEGTPDGTTRRTGNSGEITPLQTYRSGSFGSTPETERAVPRG